MTKGTADRIRLAMPGTMDVPRDDEAARIAAGLTEAHPFNPDMIKALGAATSEQWQAASQWADAAKRLMPDMEDARWQGIRHGFLAGLVYADVQAAAVRAELMKGKDNG